MQSAIKLDPSKNLNEIKEMIIPSHLVYTILFISLCFGQAPDTMWTRQFNSIENPYGSIDGALSVQQTADGGYIMTGYYCATGSALWLIKTDENGDTSWTMLYGWSTQDNDVGRCVEQTNDGGYIIAGYTMVDDYNYNRSILIRADAGGDTMWSITLGDTLFHYRNYAVQQTADSNYIVTGYMYVASTNSSRIRLWKCDDDGGTLWSKYYGYDEHTSGYAVQQTADNGYVITGNMSGSLWLAKTDADGDTLWTKFYGSDACGLSVKEISSGGYIIGGYQGSSGWLLRAQPNGDTLWTRTYVNKINAVDIVSESGYILGGLQDDLFYIARTDLNGDVLWVKTFHGLGSYYDNECMSIARTSDGGYIAAGIIATIGNSGYSDAYLVKIESDTLAVTEQYDYVTKQRCISTIVSGPLLVPEDASYTIFDITGCQIHTLDPAPGIYFIEVDGEMQQKIIKIR